MYDEKLAQRIREALKSTRGVTERKMFGGIAFLDRGNMVCGVLDDDLMLRVGPDAYASALAKPHVRLMTFTGRPMRGMVYVSAAGVRTAKALRAWIARGLRFTQALPAKK
jgi:TfoX/Sxy family transcriptional regulator of competence genes